MNRNLRRFLAILALIFGASAVALAQGDPSSLTISEVPKLTTIGGVILAAIAATNVAQRLFAGYTAFARVPTWLYVLGFTLVLTVAAHSLFHTLPGDLTTLLWSGLYNAASASGFYEWYNNFNKPLGASATAQGAQ